jgi:hypothetical protein
MSDLPCSRQRTTKIHLAEIGWWPVEFRYFLANQLEQRAHAEFAQFGSSSNCGLQFANGGHGVPANRSMCGKEAC